MIVYICLKRFLIRLKSVDCMHVFFLINRFLHENMDDVLSRCSELDHMKGKFTAAKTSEISPRIANLQKTMGFALGEPLTSSNLHRLIPAAVSMQIGMFSINFTNMCCFEFYSRCQQYVACIGYVSLCMLIFV